MSHEKAALAPYANGREGCIVYLQEALAGHNEGKLGAELVRLGLATPHPLDQLGDAVCDQLRGKTQRMAQILVNGVQSAQKAHRTSFTTDHSRASCERRVPAVRSGCTCVRGFCVSRVSAYLAAVH